MASPFASDIEVLGSDLAVGERSPHVLCPKCGGGSSRETSLLIWADPNALTAKCYRVSCGLFVKTGVSGYRKISTEQRKPATQVSQLNPEKLPDDVASWLCEKFPWLTKDILILNHVQWDDYRERVLFPIRSLDGVDEGILTRKYDELVLNESNLRGGKAKTYWKVLAKEYKLTCLMPPRNAVRENYIVLVEDYPSAMRINLELPCTALSGTSIQDAALMNLVKAGVKHVVMVLDADAVSTAAKLVHKYGIFFWSMSFIPLEGVDPKDMQDAEFTTLMAQIIERFPDGSTDTSLLRGKPSSLRRGRKAGRG